MKARSVGLVMTLALLLGAGSRLGAQAKPAPAKAAAVQPAQAQPGQQNEDEKTFYALGQMMGRNVAGWKLTPGELANLQKGLTDAVTGAPSAVDLGEYQPKIQTLAQARMAVVAQEAKAKSQVYLEQAAKEPGSIKTASGLVYRTLKAGAGASPTDSSKVKVQYEGKLADGTVFDSSVKRGQPAEFPLTNVIPCWKEGLKLMKLGEKAILACPSDIAYGEEGRPPVIPGGAALVFEVELLDVQS